MTLADIMRVYMGSDGDATRAMYQRLEALGDTGLVAVNLLRACKNSKRAKVYRRSGSRRAAYETKSWSMHVLAAVLTTEASALGIRWGWATDPQQPVHNQVLYVDLPTGQVSFHTDVRGAGPDYLGQWDGVRGFSASRVIAWTASLFREAGVAA